MQQFWDHLPHYFFFVMWIVAVDFEFLIPLKVYLFFTKRISQLCTYLGYLKPFLWKPHRPWQHITQQNRAVLRRTFNPV